jgi:hypothetical protein
MAGDSSVSVWLDGVKAGDERATRRLWDRYFSCRTMGGQTLLCAMIAVPAIAAN